MADDYKATFDRQSLVQTNPFEETNDIVLQTGGAVNPFSTVDRERLRKENPLVDAMNRSVDVNSVMVAYQEANESARTPELAAKTIKALRETGDPFVNVTADDELQKQLDDVYYQSPALLEMLKDPLKVSLLKNDVPSLTTVSGLASTLAWKLAPEPGQADGSFTSEVRNAIARSMFNYGNTVALNKNTDQFTEGVQDLQRLLEYKKRLDAGESPDEVFSQQAQATGRTTQELYEEYRNTGGARREELLSQVTEAYNNLIWARTYQQAFAPSDLAQEFGKQEGFVDSIKWVAQHPLAFAGSTVTESLTISLPSIVGAGLVTAATGGVGAPAAVGMLAGGLTMGSASYETDYGSSMASYLSSLNIDNLPEWLSSSDNVNAVLAQSDKAKAHAGVVGAVDALSFGVAGKGLTATLNKSVANALASSATISKGALTAKYVGATLGDAVAQGMLGALGEAGGQIASGDKINANEIVAEFFGEMVSAPLEVAAATQEAHANSQMLLHNAEKVQNTVMNLATAINQSETSKTSPETVGELMDMTMGGAEFTLRLDQSDPNMVERFKQDPTFTQRIEQAQATGDVVTMSASEFGRFVASNPDIAPEMLAQSVTVGGGTVEDAKADVEATKLGHEDLAELAQNTLTNALKNQEHVDAITKMNQDMAEDFEKMGNVTNEEAGAIRRLVTNLYSNLAKETDTPLADLWERERISFIGQDQVTSTPNGDVVTVGGKEFAVSPSKSRGSYFPNYRAIAKWAKGDFSTLAHESAHAYLDTRMRVLSQLGKEDELNAKQTAIVEEGNRLAQWMGFADMDAFMYADAEARRAGHEKFASTFEAYLHEGKPPHKGLEGVFQKFKDWLRVIYRTISKIHNADVSQESMELMENLFLSGQAIARKKQSAEIKAIQEALQDGLQNLPQGDDLTNAGLDLFDYDMGYIEEAENRLVKGLNKLNARHALQRKALRELIEGRDIDQLGLDENERVQVETAFETAKKLYAESKGKKTVETLRANPSMLPTLDDLDKVRISPSSMYSKGDVELLRKLRIYRTAGKPRKLTDAELKSLDDAGLIQQGVGTPDALEILAQGAGYGTVEELVADLHKFRTEKDALETLAMDVLGPQQRAERQEFPMKNVNDAILNHSRENLIKALHRMVLSRGANMGDLITKGEGDAIIETANAVVSVARIKSLKLPALRSASTRALKALTTALRNGDIKDAVQQARHALYLTAKMVAVVSAREEYENLMRDIRKLGKKEINGVDNRANSVLKAILLGAGVIKKLREAPLETSVSERIKAVEQETGVYLGVDEEFLTLLDGVQNGEFNGEFNISSLAGMRMFHNTLVAIVNWGKIIEQRRKKAYNLSVAEKQQLLASNVEAKAKKDKREINVPSSDKSRIVNGLKRLYLAHLRPRTVLARMFSADNTNLYRFIIAPLQASHDLHATLNREVSEKVFNALKPVREVINDAKARSWAGVDGTWSRQQIFALLLNFGNEGNKARMLNTVRLVLEKTWEAQYGKENLTKVIDKKLNGLPAEVFYEQQARLLIGQAMSAKEFEAANAVFKIFGDLQEESKKVMYRVQGNQAVWVEPTPLDFALSDGSQAHLDGGYYPIVYDASIGGAKQFSENVGDINIFGEEDVASGHLKERAENAPINRGLLLNVNQSLYQGLDKQMYYIAYVEWVQDMHALLGEGIFRDTIRDYWGADAVGYLDEWVNDVARGGRTDQHLGDEIAVGLRQGISLSKMGFNLVTAAVQIGGIIPSIAQVGGVHVLNGIGRYLSHGMGLTAMQDITSKSDMMKHRMNTQFKELAEIRSRTGNAFVRGRNAVGRVAYIPIVFVQGIVDGITWYAGYEKALSQGLTEEEAIVHADNAVVTSQGTGQKQELSPIEKGNNWQQLFTVFYNFFNASFNILALAKERDGMMRFIRAAFWVALMQPVVETLLREALDQATGSAGDDDDYGERVAAKVLPNVVGFNMGYLVGIRELAGLSDTIFGDRVANYSGPTGAALINDLYRLKWEKMFAKGEVDEKDLARIVGIAGQVLGLPTMPIQRGLQGSYAIDHGETDNPLVYIFGYRGK